VFRKTSRSRQGAGAPGVWSWLSAGILLLPIICLSSCTSRTVLGELVGTGATRQIHVWFVRPDGDDLRLVRVNRKSSGSDAFRSAVEELLRGPTSAEARSGIGSEIPRGTIVLDVKEKGCDIVINLSRRFASGGGSTSLETRLEQLRRTVSEAAGARKVYLDVEGERLSTATGEGLEIKQPIN